MRRGDAKSLISIAVLAVLVALFLPSAPPALYAGAAANGLVSDSAGVGADTPAADNMHGSHCIAHPDCAALVPQEGPQPRPVNEPVISFGFRTGTASMAGPPPLHPPRSL